MRIPAQRRIVVSFFVLTALLLAGWLALTGAQPALANPTVDPTSVTVVGSLQSELGCPGDWQPECTNTYLTYDAGDDLWQGTFSVPAGAWEYKAALNASWAENYGAHAVADGPNITVSLPISTAVKFYYDHKSHWITSNQNAVIAVAPGSFQSELGCPGDWQPDCLRSWLQDTDGDGIYTFATTAIPAGSYEAKVALNETWDVNYGAGGVLNGDNIAFSVAQTGDTVTFRYDATSHVLTITAGGGDDLAGLVRAPVRNPIANDVFYFVMPDRFNNGSTANDQGGLTGDRLATGFDPTDKGFYHGGDLAGLLAKMDYLKQMGITAIWMTPMFKNNPVQGSGADVSAAYHGYWITDFTQIDPHFGTNAELQAVIDAAHQRGIKIFFDIIANHTADMIKYQENQSGYRNKTDFPYKDASGQAFDDRDYVNQPFPPLSTTVSFPYTPIFANAADATIKAPAWLNNPLYYHNRGDSTFSGENSLYGDFFGLDDLFTEQPEVVNGLIDVYNSWITNFNIDGFRIDTVKHVNVEFWQKFSPAILAHAAAQGKPNFFIFGEVYSSNPQLLSYYTASGANLPAVLDFQFQQQVQAYVSQAGAADSLKTLFENDDYFTDSDSNASDLVTFLGNHDMGRFGHFLNADNNSSLSDAELLARDKLAHALLYFARGVPVVYYGDEQGFTGDGGDKDARQDMMPSQVASYNDDKLIGTTATTANDNFDPTHPLYQTFTQYAAVRAANKALRTGAQIQRVSGSAAGIFAFSRIDRDERIEYVVALNNSNAAAAAIVPTFYGAGELFTQLSTGNNVTTTLTTAASGALSVTVPAQGFVIYKASSALAPSAAAPAISLPDLTEGQQVTLTKQILDGNTVPDRLEIKANVTGNQYAEVTFAVRVTGTPTYTVIGVDDNAPYRIFYDVSKLPMTATLDIIAVVNDLNNHLVAAKVGTIKPVFKQPTSGGATYPYAVIHYQRSDNDYGDETTGNFNDFWGLHLWGDGIDPADVSPSWDKPKPFLGQDSYGRFAWIKLTDASKDLNFIVHRGDVKDGTDADRKFNPASDSPEIWLKQGDPHFYTSRAAAQGFVTIHYHRPDGVYTGWGVHLWGDGLGTGVGTTWDAPRPPAGTDDFGLYFTVPLSDTTKPVNFIIHNGDTKDPDPDQSLNPTETPAVWIQSGDPTIYPEQGAAEKFAIIHYHRADGDYGDPTSPDFANFWGLHVWDGAASPNPSWQEPVKPTGTDKFGIYFKIPLKADATELAYILHRGDTKDPGPDQRLNFGKFGNEVWQLEQADPQAPYLLPILKGVVSGGDLSKAQAHWVTADTIAWDVEFDPAIVYQLHYAPNGGLALTNGSVSGGNALTLTYDPNGLSADVKAKFPHLAAFKAFKLSAADLAKVPDILKGQIAISANANTGGALIAVNATSLQIPGVLDALDTYSGTLGVDYNGTVPTLRVWAPTAKSVQLHLFDTPTATVASQVISMTAGAQGTWSATGDATWTGKYYLYEVVVYAPSTAKVEHNLITDPYSVGLSTNSTRSLIVNLAEVQIPAMPSCSALPALSPEDRVLYELHVRDFSINDPSVPAAERGTYKAFTHADANGMKHLAALANAGLTDVHLLPVFDIASVDEDKTQWQTPNVPNAAPDSDQQQAAVTVVANQDGFNWGYDPYHYGAPEGSYAVNPEGANRIIEFRQMLAALHCTGLRVVMDVVYNHTTASGQADKSVLDKIVPDYYQRLNLDGQVETSTCCANTATEHAMMEKLMIDTLVRWAKDYGVDGFRFDLMGHHMKANMEHVRDTLHAINPNIYLYGEGWNFGEVANNARGVNATQFNLAGTGIGTFNDRLRDAVRGGGPFDGGAALIANQGFISGLYYDPNANNTGGQAEKDKLLLAADQIRVGLTGNLADYPFIDRTGVTVTGSMVDYNGSPTGYTQDPQEEIVYVEAHDNQTLFDISQFKHPTNTSIADRVRAQNLGLDLTLLGQGVPFIQAGEELLRSKSEDGNSYNSGDWFNKLDFTYQANNWGVGLPPQADNGANWPVIQPLLANPALKPSPTDIQNAFAHVKALLAIRKSSKLFRLETKADVLQRVHFANTGPDQLPGLIVMSLNDKVAGLPDLDPNHDLIVVLFNASDQTQVFTSAPLQGKVLQLHPVQASATGDPVVHQATFDPATGTFNIPARTTAVFVDTTQHTTSITIIKDAQPHSHRNFRFTGDLGDFRLDDPAADDGDAIHASVTYTVTPGTYTVKEHVPHRWHLTDIICTGAQANVDLAAHHVAIPVAEGEQATCTFTDQYSGAIKVRVYDDQNADGQRHHEPGLKNWEIKVYGADNVSVAQRKTSGAGKANFWGLRPGHYTVCETLRTDWLNSQPNELFPDFGHQPCYSVQIAPAQEYTLAFGNYDDPSFAHVVAASGSKAATGVSVATVIDPNDDENYEDDPSFVDTDEETPVVEQDLYLPLINR